MGNTSGRILTAIEAAGRMLIASHRPEPSSAATGEDLALMMPDRWIAIVRDPIGPRCTSGGA